MVMCPVEIQSLDHARSLDGAFRNTVNVGASKGVRLRRWHPNEREYEGQQDGQVSEAHNNGN